MKSTCKYLAVMALVFSALAVHAQTKLQYYRSDSREGLNVFETKKEDTVRYDGLKVKVGADFAMQFQSINHSNDADNLTWLGNNLNLPTANLNLDVQLEDGVRMHLRTYLSSRHHSEAWVKGGYLQIDKLDFISPRFMSGIMEYATIRVGMDEINYGDAHFRRSDNGRAIFNPFVGNYLMDAFSTEAFMEVNLQNGPWLAVIGITNGKLNQNVTIDASSDNKLSFMAKAGFDNQLSDDLRVRLTASLYTNPGTTTGTWLYNGDRAGSRYYHVMDTVGGNSSDFSGRIQPRFTKLTAIQINPFVKWKGLEFFGIYELASGGAEGEGAYTQIAGEALYRFGSKENLYVGGRYNKVSGSQVDGGADQEVDRINLGGGWFMTKNILAKLEYVNQSYGGDGYIGNRQFQGGEFNGVMVEAVITF